MNFDFEERNKKPLAKRIIKEILILLVEMALVIGLAYCIIQFAVERTEMIGVSMEGTLMDGDKIIVDKFSYHFKDPKRFDVVVFKQSNKEHSYYNVKRIIGLPGETIQIKDNIIYVNDEAVEDPIVADSINNAGLAGEKITLDENEYFVLGDNRNNSEDSRFANVGNITRDEIVGKAWIRLSPLQFISQLNLKANESSDVKQNKEGSEN